MQAIGPSVLSVFLVLTCRLSDRVLNSGDVPFNKLPKESGFDFAQPALAERSRWRSFSVKRKPDPTNIGDVIPTRVPYLSGR